ncbi:MAG: glycosyltransferase family 2 protein [Acidimicrobiales bacterium]
MTADRHHPVAVIVPCYNDGATLPAAVSSARVQHPAELVVVDDGSTDPATLAVLDDLEADGVTVVHRPNGGLAAARMSGVSATTSPYIVPLDADDELAAGALDALTGEMLADPDLAVVYGDLELFGTMTGRRYGGAWDAWSICHVNRIPGGGALIRRRALLDAGGWVLEHGYEDWDLWMGLLERGERAVHIEQVTYRYRQGEGRMLADCRDRHEELADRLRRRHPDLYRRRRRLWRRSAAPLHARILLPVIDRLPVGATTRHRLAVAAYDPGAAVRARRSRLTGPDHPTRRPPPSDEPVGGSRAR